MDPYLRQERRKTNAAFLSWLLVLVPSLLALLLWLSLQHAVEIALSISSVSTWSWDAIKTFAFIGFGLLWLAGVFLMQNMLYRSAVRGMLISRIMQMSALLLGLLACSQAIRLLLGAAEISIRSVLPVALEAVLAAILYALCRYFHARRIADHATKDNKPWARRT
ncbi:hypothetical protein [Paenibacillus sp. R14(2021)]|uniref:hypothetical protein n=1 Tax=Paenibacillus sp. R14(2021) TaxID=2859228 RepID=UPI001C613F30|nr:hypothetical protein [Paenibacillus sp. R14(2021)]